MSAVVRDDRASRLALTCVVDGGEPALAELLETVGPEAAWASIVGGGLGVPLAQRAASLELDQVRAQARAGGIRFVVPGDDEWPIQLEDLTRCGFIQRRGGVPVGLWLRGPAHLATIVERSVSVVGSRASTAYGSGVATDLSAELAEAGLTVVSGGAFGIDAAAHRGALAARGSTLAVLATGVDVQYPSGNSRLFDWIGQDHVLVSELPPGATPTRVRFLARNRMIAALSLGTVVVEAALRSGARNTASWALGCGRPLMAVPGPVHSSMSAAPHLMVREGQASLVTCAADVIELVSPMGENLVTYPHGASRVTDHLEPQRLSVFEAVPARRPTSAGEIALIAGLSVPSCLAELAGLEQAGLVENNDRGWRVASTSGLSGRRGP